jgi:uncharacterized phage-associated protein
MVSVHDVADYILSWRAMSAMKMQKLLYYAQAWHLATQSERLFKEPIEAWANGPVVRELYEHHRGSYTVVTWPWGDKAQLSEKEQTTVDRVLTSYGVKDAQWLSDETHAELPWREARRDLPEGARSSATISTSAMREFYHAQLRVGRGPEFAALRR